MGTVHPRVKANLQQELMRRSTSRCPTSTPQTTLTLTMTPISLQMQSRSRPQILTSTALQIRVSDHQYISRLSSRRHHRQTTATSLPSSTRPRLHRKEGMSLNFPTQWLPMLNLLCILLVKTTPVPMSHFVPLALTLKINRMKTVCQLEKSSRGWRLRGVCLSLSSKRLRTSMTSCSCKGKTWWRWTSLLESETESLHSTLTTKKAMALSDLILGSQILSMDHQQRLCLLTNQIRSRFRTPQLLSVERD